MKKITKAVVLLFIFFPFISLYAYSNIGNYLLELRSSKYVHHVNVVVSSFVSNAVVKCDVVGSCYEVGSSVGSVLAPPTVTSSVYYCRNAVANALTASPSIVGATLNWYTLPSSGIPLPSAPTPSTLTVGRTSYYVSETFGGIESSRSKIDVIVVADNGTINGTLKCDASQILPADKNSSVFFDWSNNPLNPNSYNVSYTIQGGPVFTGSTALSHWQVFGMLPGQSATLTLTHATLPCVPSQTMVCTVPCGASAVTSTFPSIPTSYCINEATTNLPTSSEDSPAITGTWSEAKVNTASAGTTNYIFSPDPVLFPCALTKTLAVTVGPVEPNFTDFEICSGVVPVPSLSSISPNGITGAWLPLSIDNTTSGAYNFTPDPGQACAPTGKTINITVNPSNTILNVGWTVTDAFADNQIVTVTDPLGANYLYQLDDGPFQQETVFERVSLGMHSITVQDVNGCSELRNDNVLVIDYPRFFTPNNDGYNDRWNIFTLDNELGAIVQIFDRYGKLLQEVSPSDSGWDGSYRGRALPATDYWFVVSYSEDGILKTFRSHFSLKR
jgi:gliding motility-associated-like protein